jgi:hypothetical protein
MPATVFATNLNAVSPLPPTSPSAKTLVTLCSSSVAGVVTLVLFLSSSVTSKVYATGASAR